VENFEINKIPLHLPILVVDEELRHCYLVGNTDLLDHVWAGLLSCPWSVILSKYFSRQIKNTDRIYNTKRLDSKASLNFWAKEIQSFTEPVKFWLQFRPPKSAILRNRFSNGRVVEVTNRPNSFSEAVFRIQNKTGSEEVKIQGQNFVSKWLTP